MSDIKKIKRTALALFVMVSFLLLWFIIKTIRGFILNNAEWYPASIAITAIGALIILTTLITALILLFASRKDETPFNAKNVKLLKIIAILLVVFEPYLFISERIFNRLHPIVLSDNSIARVHVSLGGCILAAGLVVYCVSLIFEYGVSLQKQVDETL